MYADMPQLRAARALLLFKSTRLAQDLGISSGNLSSLETGRVTNPTARTLSKLQTYYESHGVEFSSEGWVRLKPNVITSGNPQLVLNPE